MRILSFILLALSFLPHISIAQTPVPERRLTVYQDTDFAGSDLQQLFDTSQEVCARACAADARCVGYTFNSRSSACFPKSSVREKLAYEGAISVEMPLRSAAQLARAKERTAELGFLQSYELSNARAQADALPNRHPTTGWSLDAMRDAARERESVGDIFAAMRWSGAATATSDAAEDWADYARLNLALNLTKSSDKRRYAREGLSAAINAYLRSDDRTLRASALLKAARALERLGRGAATVPALKAASALSADPAIANALAAARAKHGFRVITTSVENQLANPRICAEMSEPLSKTERDFARFVALPDPRMAVTAEGTKLCVSGVLHGERYQVSLRAGLPAESGEGLIQTTPLSFYVRDRAPIVSFPGRAYILPLGGEASLPIETVNTDEVALTLRHVSDRNLLRAFQEDLFAKPLFQYQERLLGSEIGEEVWRGTGYTQNELNKDMTTRLPISEAIAEAPAGIYVMSATVKDAERGATAQQWFVLSDIGLSTAKGSDGLHVFVKSLASAEPMEGARVKLLSKSNRVLGEAVTGVDGAARFDVALTEGRAGATPALVLAETGEKDMAFLSLTEPAFDLTDRGVKGRNAPSAVDLFLTTDRGAYRAGETIYATALARDGKARAIESLPLTAVLLRPDGVEYARQLSNAPKAGGHVFSMPVAASAPRGAWALEVRAEADGPALASETLLIEDFLPERIDYAISLAQEPLRMGTPSTASIEARYLFGAPAANLNVTGRVRLTPSRALDGFEGFRFGPYDKRLSPAFQSLGRATTDANGKAQLELGLPEMRAESIPLIANIALEVAEGSGRPVARSVEQPVQPMAPLIGLKPQFKGTLPEGTEAAFDVLVLSPDLAPLSATARWTLNRLNTRYQWYEQYGRWNWEPIVTRSKVSSGALDVKDGKATLKAAVDWGRYEIVIELDGETYVAASEDFTAGWFGDGGSVSTPDTLDISLDKQTYAQGETARLRITPQRAGNAMVQVMSDELVSSEMVALSQGENIVPLLVTDRWGAGAYVTVTHISPMKSEGSFLPTRAIGLAYASVDPADKALSVTLQALDETKPRQPLNVRVKAEGLSAGDEAYVTLAAVDAGILGLTGFEPPNPEAHYFGQRKLGFELRDVYGRLIDASKGALGQTRSGGDSGADMTAEGTPPTEDLVTFFQGPVTLGPDGTADLSFEVPAFNGTLRLMAVVWSDKAVGSASKDVIIRDPIVLTASLPRFLAPGDESTLRLELTHASGPTGAAALDLSAAGLSPDLSGLPSEVMLEEGQTLAYSVPIRAEAIGDFPIEISLTSPSGEMVSHALRLPVRRLDPEVSTTRRITLAPGESLALDQNLTEAFAGRSARALITAGPIAKFDVAALLSELDRYPYGCTEQLTSGTMPLLYFSEVSEALGLASRGDVAPRIERSLRRILTRQSSSGSFGLWYASSGDLWLDAYVTDFLSRAREQGFDVPEAAFESALGNLQNAVNSAPDFDKGGRGLAYAFYVLAREQRTSVADLRYYADVKADAFDTPIARAQLAAALAYHGDQPRSDAMFGKAVALLNAQSRREGYIWRSDYGTARRDAAAVLALGSEAGSAAVNPASLSAQITGGDARRSTQEMVWTLLAAQSLLETKPQVALNGSLLDLPVFRAAHGDLVAGQTLTNQGQSAVDVTLTTLGIPSVAPEATGYGYQIDRSYYTLDGAPVSKLNLKAGERLAVRLRVTPFEKSDARLMINDALPAGLDIDNPSLLQSGDVSALSWLKSSPTQNTEFRAERFLAAVDVRGGEPVELAYIVRAVTPGRYHHPAALVEDMYRPIYRANTSASEVVISAR